jgi:hypothetical protein
MSSMVRIENTKRSSATSARSLMTSTTLSTFPYFGRLSRVRVCHVEETYEENLGADGAHRASDVLVQCRMPRLPHGRVILLPAHEEVGWVHAPHVKDRVDGNFH